MKVCILGCYSGKLDEGMANISYHIYTNLRSRYPKLYLLNLQEIGHLKFWICLFRINPDIIHYIAGPTLKGLVFVKLIQLLTRSRTIISATHTILPRTKLFRIISTLLRPDIVLVQSHKSENIFNEINYKTKFIPNGVDTERFAPVSTERKNEIRKRYGFSERDFIALHIGPVKKGRNQKLLLQIQDAKILIIVSITNPSDQTAYEELTRTKAIVLKEYFPNIQEIYAMADVYIWPAFEELRGIEMPLTILEAMSCNLPVISTKHRALNRIFEQGKGLIFIDNEKQIQESIVEIRNNTISINTREKVKVFSWKNITNKIAEVYEDIYRDAK
jgi:glycosyltransferase involved in cell wall biosynthesis